MSLTPKEEDICIIKDEWASIKEDEPTEMEIEACENFEFDFTKQGQIFKEGDILTLLLPLHYEEVFLDKIDFSEHVIAYSDTSPAIDNIFGEPFIIQFVNRINAISEICQNNMVSLITIEKEKKNEIISSRKLRLIFFDDEEIYKCFSCPNSFHQKFIQLTSYNFEKVAKSKLDSPEKSIFYKNQKLCSLKAIWLHTDDEIFGFARSDDYKLFSGWVSRFEQILYFGSKSIEFFLTNYEEREDFEDKLLSPQLKIFLEKLKQADDFEVRIEVLVNQSLSDSGLSFIDDLKNWKSSLEAELHTRQLVCLVKLHPRLTNYGLSFVTEEIVEQNWKLISAEVDFRKVSSLENFWIQFPVEFDIPTAVLDASDIHINLTETQIEKLPRTKHNEIKDSISIAKEFLDSAIAFGRWTIPEGAVVEVNTPIFSHFIFFERRSTVYIKGLSKSGTYSIFAISTADPKFNYMTIQNQISGIESFHGTRTSELFSSQKNTHNKIDLLEEIETAFFLLISSIIHDFKVPEEREKVFSSVYPKRKSLPKNLKDEGVRVVYLPRVVYNSQPKLNEVANEIKRSGTVSKHFVRHHLRSISGHASSFQKALAKKYGITYIPEGKTFVSGHYKGGKEKVIIYKSRTASNLLYEERVDLPKQQNEKVEWFQFERDVFNILKSLGLEVVHTASSLNGDGGVDLLAEEKGKLDIMQWVIQCKCWNRSVEPAVVREMIGTLDSQKGSRGMIVTTSTFTKGAIKLAEEYKIKLINGEEFHKMLINNIKE
jgi:hypothetical protein